MLSVQTSRYHVKKQCMSMTSVNEDHIINCHSHVHCGP